MPNFPKSSRTFLNGPSLYANTPLLQTENCAKCGKPREGHDDSTHAFTTNASDPDYEGGDTYDVKPVDPDAPGTKGKPGYEPPVRRSDLDEEGKKIWDSRRKPK